jgi:hypothetical protein
MIRTLIAPALVSVMVFCSSLSFAQSKVETPIKHQETVQAGPYRVVVGFSEWPLQAERSLHITYSPDGGIGGLKGVRKFVPAGGLSEDQKDRYPFDARFFRFTRDQSTWGDDDISLTTEGNYALEISVDGPKGKGVGRLENLNFGERPAGPPASLIYALSLIPVLALLVISARAWRQVRPGSRRETHAW